LGYFTPYEVHGELAEKRREQRSAVLKQAFERNPQRFVRGMPKPALLPAAAWINKPKEISRTDDAVAENSLTTGIDQKNDFHTSPLTNDRPLVRGMGRAENLPSEHGVV
jgi:hypothetical protein